MNWQVGSDGAGESQHCSTHSGVPGESLVQKAAPAKQFFTSLSWKDMSWGQVVSARLGHDPTLLPMQRPLCLMRGHSSLSGVGVTCCKEFWDQGTGPRYGFIIVSKVKGMVLSTTNLLQRFCFIHKIRAIISVHSRHIKQG